MIYYLALACHLPNIYALRRFWATFGNALGGKPYWYVIRVVYARRIPSHGFKDFPFVVTFFHRMHHFCSSASLSDSYSMYDFFFFCLDAVDLNPFVTIVDRRKCA